MFGAIERMPYRQILVAGFIVLAFCVSVIQIIREFAAGETLSMMTDDLLMLVVSTLVMLVLCYEYFAHRRMLNELREQLDKSRGQLTAIDEDAPKIARQYREVMQKQFDIWQLTESEQDVVIGLLKGLSFREVAELRGTREKTVRQQAVNVYKKAGVSGRNELAAWFFEDLLDPR